MSQHVHFDIDKMRADYIATNAAALADARGKAKSDLDRMGIDLQERFLPLLMESSLIAAQARNDGFDELDISKAFGLAIGNVAGNYLANMLRRGMPEAALTASEQMSKIVDMCLAGNPDVPGMSSAYMQHATVQGSRA